jgi:hypothetical protein
VVSNVRWCLLRSALSHGGLILRRRNPTKFSAYSLIRINYQFEGSGGHKYVKNVEEFLMIKIINNLLFISVSERHRELFDTVNNCCYDNNI